MDLSVVSASSAGIPARRLRQSTGINETSYAGPNRGLDPFWLGLA